MGLELSGVIDPDLNWKTATKGRRRAVRRARSSLFGENRKNCTDKTSINSKDIADKESIGDVSISESEKVGVSILGQRFSESLESVPIKKRRFLLSCSSSPLPPSSHSDYLDDFSINQTASFQATSPYERHRKRRSTSNKISSFTNINDKVCETADFYGISILASAACSSDTVGDVINDEGLNSKGHSSKGEVLSNIIRSEEKVQHMLIAEDLEKKCNLPMETCCAVSEVIDGLASNKSSIASLQDISDKMKPSSCYPKHNWDLNMDVWDNSCHEIVNCQPLATDHKVESSQSERKLVLETSNSEVDATCVSEFENQNFDVVGSLMDTHVALSQSERKSVVESSNSEEDAACVSEFKNHSCDIVVSLMDNDVALKAEAGKEHDISNVKLSDSKEAKQCSSSCGYGSAEINQQLDDNFVSLVDSNEETTPVNDQRIYLCCAKDISSIDKTFISYPGKSDEVSKSVDEPTTILVCGDNASYHTTPHNAHFSLDESISEQIRNENADENKSTDNNVESNADDNFLIDSHLGSFNIVNPQIDKNSGLPNSDNINDYPSSKHLDDVASEEPVDENVCMNANATYDISDEVVRSDGLVIARKHHGDESYRVGTEPCPSSTFCCDTIESSNNEMFPSGTTDDGKYNMGALDQIAGDHECAILSDVNLISAKNDDNGHSNLKACILMSPGTTPLQVDTDMVDDDVGVKVESICCLDSCVKSPEDVGWNDKLSCTSGKNATNNDAYQATVMEKVDLLEDDSQYEDGEFRESVLHGWGDAAEEEEVEHLDYGSDNRENDAIEPPSSAPVCLPFDRMACKGMQVATCDAHSSSCKDMQLTIYQPFLKCSSMLEGSDSGHDRNGAGRTQMDYLGLNDVRKSRRVIGGASLSVLNSVDDCDRETSTSMRMKMSGWDQLPKSHRDKREKLSDTGIASTKNHVDGSKAVGTSGSFVKACSSFKRDFSSRIERPSLSDEARRSYGRVSRSDDVDAKPEGDVGVPNLSGRYGPSLQAQGRDRGERWFEPSNHCVPRNHDSSAYYGTHRFSQSSSGNAAAAAVAKVESNGFVVAPDGTLVKAGGVGPAGRLPRRSANDPLHASKYSISEKGSSSGRNPTCDVWKRIPRPREMSPDRRFTDNRDRAGRYDHVMVRSRYHIHVPDNDSNLDLLHFPRRGRNFSPRGNLQLSRSRSSSPSRSRTRSPRHWTSTKEGGVRMGGGPVLRRRSRSPLIFKQDSRMGRMRSPHHRPNCGDHIMAYGPRIRASPPHAPSDSRKESPDHLRELEYRQDSGSSATMRMLRKQRFNSMDSHGRLKPDEYYCSLPSGKDPKYAVDGRGSDLDRRIQDRRRGHANKYELQKHDMDSGIKHARYDVEESFQSRSMGFRRMRSPGNFNRKTHTHLEDSPEKV